MLHANVLRMIFCYSKEWLDYIFTEPLRLSMDKIVDLTYKTLILEI